MDGQVNISADVADNNTVSEVWINITYPGGSWINITMNKASGFAYYYNESYDSEGTYQFTIWANDAGNYWAFESSTFVIQDTTLPTITNLQPPSELTTNEDTPVISADYSDASGIDMSSVLLKVDKVDVTVDASILAGGVTYMPGAALSDELHSIYLEVRDASENGNLASVTWSFTVDTTMPDTLPPNYHGIYVSQVETYCPRFQVVYTHNPLVKTLFEQAGYDVREHEEFEREELWGTTIRDRMINGKSWKDCVPPKVAEYIEEIDGVGRLKRLSGSDEPRK